MVAPGAVHPHETGGGGEHPRRLALAAMALRLGSPNEGSVARPDPDEPVDGDYPRRRPPSAWLLGLVCQQMNSIIRVTYCLVLPHVDVRVHSHTRCRVPVAADDYQGVARVSRS